MSELLGGLEDRTFARATAATPWVTRVIAEGDHAVHIAVIIEGPAEVTEPQQVPADLQTAATGDWVSAWIRFTFLRQSTCCPTQTKTRSQSWP